MIGWINEIAGQWAEYFGWAVVQHTLFLGIIILLLGFLRDAPARIRYWIGMAGLIKLAIPPFLSAPFFKPDTIPLMSSEFASTGIPPMAGNPEMSLPPVGLDLAAMLFITWCVFFILFTLWPVIASLRMRRQLASAQPVEDWRSEGIPIFKSNRINVPMTFGLIRERIYVPLIWDEWSDETRRMILNHEIAHIRRGDGLGRAFQLLVQAVYFFHPLVWFVSRKMNEYREMACDDLSTRGEKTLSVEYSRALVQIAENLMRSAVDCPSASALIRRKNELLNRVQYQMEDTMKIISGKRTTLILGGLLALAVPLSWMKAKPSGVESQLQTQQKGQTQYETNLMSFPEGGVEAIQKNLIYPEAARKAGIEGHVVVQVHSTQNGFKDAEIIESSFEKGKDLGCQQAALDAVQSVRWGKVKGAKEAGGWMNVPIEFRLNSPSSQPGVGMIYGKVADFQEKPLSAANVIVEGTNFDISTDMNGFYRISNIKPGIYSIQVQLIGYKTEINERVSVKISDSTKVDFKLKEINLDGQNVIPVTPNKNEPLFKLLDNQSVAASARTQFKSTGKVVDDEGNPSKSAASLADSGIVWVSFDEPPKLIEETSNNPVYPEEARKVGAEGKVILNLQIDENGKLVQTLVQQSSGRSDLDEAAKNSIKNSKWNPAMKAGKPIKVWVAMPFAFELDKEKAKEVIRDKTDQGRLSNHIEWLVEEINNKYVKPNVKFQGTQKTATIRVQMNESGHLTSVSIYKTCGDSIYDQAAITAVTKVQNKLIEQKLNQYEEFIMQVDLGVGGNPDDVKKWYARKFEGNI